MRITRRKMLKGAVALGTGALLAGAPVRGRVAQAAEEGTNKGSPGILYDLTKCVGCHLCQVACQLNKGLPPDVELIRFRGADPSDPKEAWAVRRHQCMHCLDPACASICPVAAMYKTPEGPVIYRDERCLGCRYCMNACPFGVPTFDWDRGLLDGALIRKCNMCYERQQKGERPACIEACPTGAVQFGKRDELLAQAKKLLADHPDKYVNHIYGETEAGGTGFLLISGIPFDHLGLPDPGTKPLPPLSEKVMGLTLPVGGTWGAILAGVTAFTHLREKNQEKKAAAADRHEVPGKEEP
jgi:formate dehydrogenase iron-sulfur subunit